MKRLLIVLFVLGLFATANAINIDISDAVYTNIDSDEFKLENIHALGRDWYADFIWAGTVFEATDYGPWTPTTAILYGPSEGDDPAYRQDISDWCSGATVDYYDARNSTPSVAELSEYGAVHVWANYAFADPVAYGDNLADYVDGGGVVVLGAFCTYTTGNSLAGRIMTDAYCPVYSPSGGNHFTASDYADDGVGFLYDGITDFGATYRDYLSLQGEGYQDGSFVDNEIAGALGHGDQVIYCNGSGGSPVRGTGQIAEWVGNGCQVVGGDAAVGRDITPYNDRVVDFGVPNIK
jgi:hypothetical protein